MILTRRELLARWQARQNHSGRAPNIRVTQKLTHTDSFFTQITEGHVGALHVDGDVDGTTKVMVCIGGDGRHGDGCWVTAFLGSEKTSLGLSRHLEITVELIE